MKQWDRCDKCGKVVLKSKLNRIPVKETLISRIFGLIISCFYGGPGDNFAYLCDDCIKKN